MRVTARGIAILLVALVFSAACATFLILRVTTQPPILDLSQSRDLASIPWASKGADPSHRIHTYDRRVIVHFDRDHSFDGHVIWVSLDVENGAVKAVTLGLPNQTAEEAFQTSVRLARQWDIAIEPLENWYKRDSAGQHNVAEARRNDLPTRPSIEIRSSYEKQKPYWISYSVYW